MPYKYELCSQPEPQSLAKNGPPENVFGFLRALDAQHRYWSGVEHQAHKDMDFAKGTVSEVLHKELFLTTAFLKIPPALIDNPEIVEYNRQRAIGVLGMSLLLRQVIRKDEPLGDGFGLGEDWDGADALIGDMVDVPGDHRVHLAVEGVADLLGDWQEEGQSDAWYEGTALFVHRVRPAEPSDVLLTRLAGTRVPVDFGKVETLYPYVKSK